MHKVKGILLIILSLGMINISCENKQKDELSFTEKNIPAVLRPSNEQRPIIKFNNSKVYFGNIVEGDTLRYTYKFENTGNLPLKIVSVNASCGCTTPEWTKEIVEPGEKGYIRINFDSHGRVGLNSKSVTVYANTLPMDNQVSFRVNVTEK